MTDLAPQTKYLKDYTPSAFAIQKTALWFELGECLTTVKSRLEIERQGAADAPLVLDGEDMRLVELSIDGTSLMTDQFSISDHNLTIDVVPDRFVLEIEVEINPGANKSLSGLYASHGNYCTQCESHGFRRITYFLDRPDVMSVFTTTITADVASFPHLLSNGNCIDQGDLPGGRHWVKWHDPSRKPSYLFALVAGHFEVLTDTFQTCDGRTVALALYVEEGKISQAGFAMSCLKKSMKWDEERYHRVYDLDNYMIVAVSDFNFGAMENKGLNVFNDRYILAKGDTATDHDFLGVDVVIAHEYFHNWSGNRVTLRDWFQLSLKEGLTVYREQKYTEAIGIKEAVRLGQAKIIETAQFKEDAGPMAHPIRPSSYIDMNNFYTVTVYNKGAEVVRMLETLLGEEAFGNALDVYFERFDGQAVTTQDFVDVMADSSGVDLKQFRLWYDQAGTPEVKVQTHYDAETQCLRIDFSQETKPTHGQAIKVDLPIPLLCRLHDSEGAVMSVQPQDALTLKSDGQWLFTLKKSHAQLVFEGIKRHPIVSCLESFSAPVRLHHEMSMQDRCVLARHAEDGYQQRHQMMRLYLACIEKLLACDHADKFPILDDALVDAFEYLLMHPEMDPLLIKEIIEIPSDGYLLECLPGTDLTKLCAAGQYLRAQLATRLQDALQQRYHALAPNVPYQYALMEVSKRALRHYCLFLLNMLDDRTYTQKAVDQYKIADNMTDRMGAISALLQRSTPELDTVLQDFFDRYQHDPLVVDKWFSVQACARGEDALARVQKLTQHEAFDLMNPNRVRALIGVFSQTNLSAFHREDGAGYAFLAKKIDQIQSFNPQLAARMLTPFLYWNRFDPKRQQLMLAQLRTMLQNHPKKNVFELLTRALADAPTEDAAEDHVT